MSRISTLCILLLFICLTAGAQDKVIKTNGDTIMAKVLEIGTNAISYKKANMPDGATFTELKSEIRLIIFSNGTIEYITKKTDQNQSTDNNQSGTSTSTNSNSQSQKNKIEMANGKYFINGQKASQKEVNRMLAKSNNPAVTIPLKAAKATKTVQKIIKITSFPTTIGGGIGSLVSGIDLINDIRRGRDNTKTYVNFFTSMFTTISLPITNKILKKKSDKMYSKLIDVYNVTN
ncbi:MAG TPA: hypothetical protein VNZ49_17730 [Bacteroidia bacterium]|jgi:hypothetical protein|nr:hypothetical protein [Bacteroidia bacterium]